MFLGLKQSLILQLILFSKKRERYQLSPTDLQFRTVLLFPTSNDSPIKRAERNAVRERISLSLSKKNVQLR